METNKDWVAGWGLHGLEVCPGDDCIKWPCGPLA